MSAPRGNGDPGHTVMIVDDSPTNLQILIRILEGSGHRILVAKTGPSALKIVKQERPDVILLDVMMPGMDGFEVCRHLKADAETRDSVVIFLSALGDVSDKISGLDLGAADYITKPFQAEEVLARVSGQLQRRDLQREVQSSRDRLARELRVAGEMQRALLPKLPAVERLTFDAYYRTSLHASGDYYDVLALGSGRAAVMVADVAGHGASAAIVMAMLRTALHTYGGPLEDPEGVLCHLNDHFEYLRQRTTFSTAIYAVLDPPAGRMRLARAGHPEPLVVRNGAPAAALEVPGTVPLFIGDLRSVPVSEHPLRPGDRLLFHTDGVTDLESPAGDRYQLARLTAELDRRAALPPADLMAGLVADLESFGGGADPRDDQTLLLVAVD
jgi:sigma-B regulation protein RsbU (phosphoserine phosphatase)